MVTATRRLPSSLDAERSILAAVLSNPDAIVRVAHMLDVQDFYSPVHQDVWQAVQGLYVKRQPIDLVTLNEALRDKQIEPSVTAGLFDNYHGSNNIEAHAKLVRGSRKKRDLIEAAAQMAMLAHSDRDSDEVEIAAKELVLSAVGTDNGEENEVHLSPEKQANMIREMMDARRRGESKGISTGLAFLDKVLAGGVHRDELIIIAARTSVGKSALAENFIENVAKAGGRILNVQLEMSPEQVLERYLLRGNVPRDVVKGERMPIESESDLIEQMIVQRQQWKNHLYNKPGATAMHVNSEASRLMLQEGQLDLIVVDYLQLMGDVNEDKMVTSIAKVTKRMKIMARELHTPVILISQLNRGVEHRGGKPQLHDLAHSSAIENDADVVILLWDTPDKPDMHGSITNMYVAKNRQGQKNVTIPIRYYGERFKFFDTSGEPAYGQHQPVAGSGSEAGEEAEVDLESVLTELEEGREQPAEGGEEVRESVRDEVHGASTGEDAEAGG